MIIEEQYKGVLSLVLETEQLKVRVIPSVGGKISSIYNKEKDFELLFQNKEEVYRSAEIYDDFSEYDASGFDDAFPTIDTCSVLIGEKEVLYPDHGEIWAGEFSYEVIDNVVCLNYSSSILDYDYTKRIELTDSGLIVEYDIKNTGTHLMPYIWTMHCLINCEEGMRFIFPSEPYDALNVMDNKKLGDIGNILALTDDLMTVESVEAKDMKKYYLNGKVNEGLCGAYYPSKDITYKVHYDKNILPYLGIWITEGGFRGDYNCALEPATGFYDNTEQAIKNNTACCLKANETLKFSLKIDLY